MTSRGCARPRQFELDALGEALQLFTAAAAHDHLDTAHRQAAEVAVKAIETRLARPWDPR